jgi:hypothetical protein
LQVRYADAVTSLDPQPINSITPDLIEWSLASFWLPLAAGSRGGGPAATQEPVQPASVHGPILLLCLMAMARAAEPNAPLAGMAET